MTPLERALETLLANTAEIRSTLQSRTDLMEGIAAISALVMPHLAGHAYERGRLDAALQARRVPQDSFNRGLFLTSVSAFEGFVKMLVSALVQQKSAGATKFSDLPPALRQQYIVRASQVLSNLGSGSVKGIPFNFSSLQKTMGACLVNSGKPSLEGDVFTILMGNPTWNRLIDVLESIGIAKPFDQRFGTSPPLRAWGRAGWSSNLSQAESRLDDCITKRNLIVHAAQPVTIVEQDIIGACDFFEAIAKSLVAEMPGRL